MEYAESIYLQANLISAIILHLINAIQFFLFKHFFLESYFFLSVSESP